MGKNGGDIRQCREHASSSTRAVLKEPGLGGPARPRKGLSGVGGRSP